MFSVDNNLLQEHENGYTAITTKNILNTENLVNFYTQYNIVLELANNKPRGFNKEEHEELLKETIKINLRNITQEIIRLLQITPNFISTEYFKQITRLQRLYHMLL